ncbi:polyneuridine-aldehyde esterase-like [Juglans regia]|uniref:Polyneuridine-aldehyde esterase-like n=1 Tax=Juglans regia TaxID=51240 RepID=A0A6P9E465_JUGRE|nr:polyneuridine-aldehyde esterase-like [Juglans regia]
MATSVYANKIHESGITSSGIHPKQLHEVKSLSEYLEPLMEFMASPALMEEKVVLVGHSNGGLCISVAMEKFPERVSVAVYATAVMPGPDLSILTLGEEDLTLAMSLVRPIRLYGDTATLQKEANLSREKYGQVPRVYIICEEDNVMKVDFQRWMIENNPAPEVKVIAGSDHMVMFSQPKELCSCLLEIAEKYP